MNSSCDHRLTLSYGLRYEYRPPITEARNNIIGFDKANDAVVLPLSEDQMVQRGYTKASVYNQFLAIGMKVETPQQAGLPHNMVYPNKHDFGPRAGIAYRVGRKRAIGGSARRLRPVLLSDSQLRLRSRYAQQSAGERFIHLQLQLDHLPAAAELCAAFGSDGGCRSQQHERGERQARRTQSRRDRSNPLVYFNPHLPTSRAHQWNVTLEKEIMDNTVVSAS